MTSTFRSLLAVFMLPLAMLLTLIAAPVSSPAIQLESAVEQNLTDDGVELDWSDEALAHISRCNPDMPSLASKAGRHFVGGIGGFRCDDTANHHDFVELKMSVQKLTLNMPGTRFDQYGNVIADDLNQYTGVYMPGYMTALGREGDMSPRSVTSFNTNGRGYPTVAPCLGNGVYRIQAVLNIFGAHGARQHIANGTARFLECPRQPARR